MIQFDSQPGDRQGALAVLPHGVRPLSLQTSSRTSRAYINQQPVDHGQSQSTPLQKQSSPILSSSSCSSLQPPGGVQTEWYVFIGTGTRFSPDPRPLCYLRSQPGKPHCSISARPRLSSCPLPSPCPQSPTYLHSIRTKLSTSP